MALPGASPHPGDPAPDFALQDTHGTPVRLAELRGRAVFLVFFPFAFTPVCTSELREVRDNLRDFEASRATVFGVSCDSVFALRAWGQHERFGFELLSDFWPHGDVARRYGVLDEGDGLALRGSFLIDAGGIVRRAVVNGRGEPRDLAWYREALATI